MISGGLRTVPRLVINPGSEQAWEIELHRGANSFGRGPDNDHPIEHASVSSSHCEIVVTDAGALIKDLGSTNGTFVEGQLVEEAILIPGQTVCLGTVEARFEWEQALAPRPAADPPAQSISANPSPAPVARASSPGKAFCQSHPRTRARFSCPKCGRSFCELCVNTRPRGAGTRKFCRSCGLECTRLEVPSVRLGTPRLSFPRQVAGAFLYPLRGDGVTLLVAGTIVYALIDAASFVAGFALMFGLVAIAFLFLFGTGYLTAYLRRILNSSAIGEEEMPDWPDFSDFGSDIACPFFQLLGTILACFVPALVLGLFVGAQYAWRDWAIAAAYVFACLYFPMAFLAVAMFDTIAAVNPLLVIPAIVKVYKEYFLTILLFGLILLARWGADELVTRGMSLPLRLMYSVTSSFIGLYLVTVEMRILGLLYLCKKAELGWFNH